MGPQDAAAKILDHLEGKPDLIIGNYTDGNLVASLVATKLGVTQVLMMMMLLSSLLLHATSERALKPLTRDTHSVECDFILLQKIANDIDLSRQTREPLHMPLKRQSMRILMSSGRNWMKSTTSHANSLLT